MTTRRVPTTEKVEELIAAEATLREAADALRLLLTGGTMSGNIAMGTNKVTGL
ncbi:unnamed protein product, partial [marine sediment metagenome]